MREADFQSEWTRSIHRLHKDDLDSYDYWKIPDSASIDGFSAQKPYDCYFMHNDNYFAFELKQVRTTASFAFTNLLDHQFVRLKRVSKVGPHFHAFVVINYRKATRMTPSEIKRFGDKGMNFTLCIPFPRYEMEIKTYEKDRRSIPFERILELHKEFGVERFLDTADSVPIWDIRKFLTYFYA